MKLGDFVNLSIIDPKEQFWGRLLSLTEAGISLRCIPTAQIEAFKYQQRSEEIRVYPQTLFFPMRRVMQMTLDEQMGNVSAVHQDICTYGGIDQDDLLNPSS